MEYQIECKNPVVDFYSRAIQCFTEALFICLNCLAFLVDNEEGYTSDCQVGDVNSLEKVKVPPVSPDLSSIKISILLGGGLPVKLLSSREPLLANEQNVVQSLQVYYKDHDGFDCEDS